ncbi:hypothetical protein Fisuc_2691 [Fibrobacter succinogenes subsp. succinogenes S85]|uniref:TIGR02646 family protein n=1 Tax=Fibrobacter succinogenes (strain ATCC 19169 / S85) TaxID=59374 RepID=A0ABM5LKU9_FIBSS|nr:retron system putative HNH endonuclease [Fibrobacter succinogenes]ACX76274.1 hypothetical protein Fisuc_2691 [Fibrobacter succinogenes subsp. succinogenes S85]
MISVKKNASLNSFTDYVYREKPRTWEDLHKQTKFPDLYSQIKLALIKEQGGVSAYTEEPISPKSHIDHFYKRSLFPKRTFDWNNLFVDGLSEHYGAKYKDSIVTNKRDYDLLISPNENNVERYFTYMENGEIIVAPGLSKQEAQRADYTIKTFNLNNSELKSRRARILKNVHDFGMGLTPNDIRSALVDAGFKTVVEYALI